MKRVRIHFIFLVALIWSSALLANEPGKDFLITLDGSKLTGVIKTITIKQKKTQISFENDFGSRYIVDASTIFGFAFQEQGEISLFESKFLNGEWQFLRVETRGNAVSLYTSSERQLQFVGSDETPIVVQEQKSPQIWLQFEGEQPFRVYRFNFRGVLRKRMKSHPELAKRIGKRGFRYKNLSMIVESYNRYHKENDEDITSKQG